ncbi:MAG TPA: hypothetical protein VNA57_01835 [Acidimicrobiales bacterium]|nr:hypothetical protein [Acidimicrobiales bacterium]
MNQGLLPPVERPRGTRRTGAVFCVLMALVAAVPVITVASVSAQTSPGWQTLAPLLAPGESSQATAGVGGDRRIYYIRGGTGNEVYDIDRNEWTVLKDATAPRSAVATVTDLDGRIYLIGGNLGHPTTGSYVPSPLVEAYEPSTGTWARVAELNEPRTNPSAVTDHDGRIYVIGGNSGSPAVGITAEVYDPQAPDEGWQKVPSMTLPGGNTGVPPNSSFLGNLAVPPATEATTGSDGRIYLIVGSGDFFGVFDPDEPDEGWQSLSPVPTKRGVTFDVAAGPDGLIYVIGGTASRYLDTVEAYDPVEESWIEKPPMPTPRGYVAAATGVDGRITR